MSIYTYYTNIPAANNDPGADQPLMLQNFSSLSSLISEDHIGFNTASGGYHKQATFINYVSPTTPSGTASVLYPSTPDSGTTINASFQNANNTYLLNCVKAFGNFTATSSASFVNSMNCASVSQTTTTSWTVTLNTNTVRNNSAAVIATIKGTTTSGVPSWTLSGTSLVFSVKSAPTDSPSINFVLLQL